MRSNHRHTIMTEIKKANLTFPKPFTKRKKTTEIILHCAATKEGVNYSVKAIHNMHIKKGWNGIAYNYYIDLYGTIWEGRPEDCVGAHTTDHNSISIGICYCGGVDKNNKAKDTRTPAQVAAMIWLCRYLHKKYPNATFHGHREFANKACPSFDVKTWIKTFDLNMPDNNLTPVVKNVDVKKVADATTKLIDKISKMFTKK